MHFDVLVSTCGEAYLGSLHSVGENNDVGDPLLPDHAPEVVLGVHLGACPQRNRTCKCFTRVLLLGPGTNRKGEYNNYCLRRVFTLGPVAHGNRTYTCLRKVFTLGLGAHGNVTYRCLTRVFTGAQVAYKCLTRSFPLRPGAHGNRAYKSLKIERVHPGPK